MANLLGEQRHKKKGKGKHPTSYQKKPQYTLNIFYTFKVID